VSSSVGLLTPALFGFLMVSFRCAALCMTAPILSAKAVPNRVRLSLALVVSMAVWLGAGAPPYFATQSLAGLAGRALVETLIGVSGGLAARFMVDGLMAAGQLIATVMGLSYGSILDPVHGAESTALGEILSMASLGVMVALGLHREAIVWLCRSVVELPPMAPVELGRFFGHVLSQAIEGAALGVRLAFPIMTAVTFGHVAMGVIGRGAEQVNLSSIGFSVTILAGGGALYVMAPTIAEMAARAALAAFTGGVG